SFTDVSLEARFRITESFGIVPFVDGGMVYESSMPDWGRDLSWGVGLGFRYYTLIGPIRLDIATPLQDRDNNKAFQIYLSIGQAF
ncbi:BamA/TamA family outer membrane protein, partial [uncultured Bilophila sp.]|uniref:BamA/TamA family outer membrane protein n=1 Tax=uncultured Bilophila sp. TaxID=529385 RepID=UPI00280B6345